MTNLYRHIIVFGLLFALVFSCENVSAANRFLTHREISDLIEKGEALCKSEENVKASNVLLQAKLEAQENGFDDLLYLADIDLGSVYYNLGDNGESLFCFYDALELAKKDDDWEKRATALNGIAGGYFSEGDYAKAHEMTAECLKEAIFQKDSVAVVDFALNLVRIANKRNDYVNAKKYSDVVDNYMTKGYSTTIAPVLNDCRMEMFFLHKEYDKALTLANDLINRKNYSSGKASALTIMAEICEAKGDARGTITYANMALPYAGMNVKVKLYKLLASAYENMGKPDSVVCYKDSAIICSDSLNDRTVRQVIDKSRMQFEANGIRQQFYEQRESLAKTRFYVACLVLLLVFVIAGSMAFVYRQRKKKQEEQVILEQERAQQQESMQRKNQELTMATMITSSRNEVVGNLIHQLQDIKAIQGNEEVKMLMSNLKQQLRDSVTQDDFLINFEIANPNFAENIRKAHPDLQPSDIRFLAYLLQNMPLSDIASLLNITTDSCKRKKIRISKKLGLESSTMLYEYLLKFKK